MLLPTVHRDPVHEVTHPGDSRVERGVVDQPCHLAYRGVEPALLHELDLAFFEDRFEGATPAEQRVLEAMARVDGRVPLSRLHAALPEVSGLNLLVRRLVERGLIYRPTRGAYDFALPLFRDHLERRAKVTKVARSVTAGRATAPER